MDAQTVVSSSEDETVQIACRLASELTGGDVVLFYGDLGAGKTAFIRGLVGYFNQSISVTSPTFTLINIYPTTPQIFHFDLYRLKGENDLADLGFSDYLEAGGIVLVEWAEKCGDMVPKGARIVKLEIEGESRRRISIEKRG